MAQAKSVNNFSKGLSLSSDYVNQAKDTYSYALNAVKEDSTNIYSTLTNEKGFTDYETNLGYDYILLGSIYLGKEDRVLFVKHLDGAITEFNKIVLIRNNTISTILDNIDLGFQTNNPIKGTYRINYKNEVIIYWVDGINEDRVLNIDNGEVITDLDTLSIDIKYTPAILTSKVINDNNGSLKTGAYEFYASYISEDNATTPWFLLSANPSYIIDDSTNDLSLSEYINVDGTDSDVITTKSITLNIENLDQDFSKLRLGIIKTIGNVSTAYYVDGISYSESSKTIEYTGFAEEIPVGDINEFVVDQVKYYGSNAIAQSAGRLLRANVKSSNIDIDYQSYANSIEVNYYIEEELVMSVPNSTDYTVRSEWWKYAAAKYTDNKSLMRDEVYSIGIAFGLIREGIETPVYHIPGRALNSIPSNVYTNQYSDGTNPSTTVWDTDPITENGETVPRWKVVNTAALSTDESIKKLGYWESDEKYPEGFGFPITGSTTTGEGLTNIRHHKAPSTALEPLYRLTTDGGNNNYYKRNIGLSFSNIVVPDEIKDNISYIRIYITPRNTDSNKSIVAKGIFTNTSLSKISINENDDSSDNYWVYPIQPYNDQDDLFNDARRNNSKGTNSWNTTTNHYHSFYSPDTLLRNPVINTDKVTIEREITGIVHYYNVIAPYININPIYTRKDDRGNGHKNSAGSGDSWGGYKRDLFFKDNGRLVTKYRTSSRSDDDETIVYNLSTEFRSTYKSISIFNTEDKISNSKSRRKIKKAVYVPFNAKLSTDQLGGMDNPYYSPYGPANVLVELDPEYDVLGSTETTDTSFDFKDNDLSRNGISDVDLDAFDQGKIYGTYHFHTIVNPTAVYRYGALKKTNNSQYGRVDGLEYIPTDLVQVNPTFDINNTLTTEFKGLIGDSWIDSFSIKRVRWASKVDYTFLGLPESHVGVSTFFTESNINHRLRYAEGGEGKDYYPKAILTTDVREWLDDYENIILKDNYYKYNTDFNTIASKRNFSLDLVDLDLGQVKSFPTRILYSEKLLDEQRSDSYRIYLANNYKDLPKDKGSIAHLFNKGAELYAITRDTVWKIFASNQTIKSESEDNITVGTGEFFSLDPIDVLSIEGGYAGSSSKMSLVETPYGYFYCDRYKGRFILFNEQLKDISLTGATEFLKENYELEITKQISALETEFDSPLSNYGYVVGYDSSLQRILITKLDYKFTADTFLRYTGEYNDSTVYEAGDIYYKDGIFYEYGSTSSEYVTLYESSDLSDFTTSTVEDIDYSFTTPTSGSLAKDPSDNTQLIYTPVSGYVGTSTFNITASCLVEPITITVEDSPVLNDVTTSISSDVANSTLVTTLSGTYTTALTYEIVSSDDVSNVFSLSSGGALTVIDNSTINTDIKDQYTFNVKATGTDAKYDTATVTINVNAAAQVLTGVDQSVSILDTTASATLIHTLTSATYTNTTDPILIYTLVSESIEGVFEYDLDQDVLSVTLINNASLNAVTTPTYTITFKVEDNNDSTIFDNFTLTINVLYDPATLSNESGDFTCSTGLA